MGDAGPLSSRTPAADGKGCGAATGRRRSVITARAFAVMDGTSRNPPGPRHTTPAVVPPPARPPAFLGGGAPEGAALEAFKDLSPRRRPRPRARGPRPRRGGRRARARGARPLRRRAGGARPP